MAAPSYTTDLTTIATGDLNVDAGTWDESSNAGWDTGGAMVDDQNLYYNNTECVSAQMTKDSNGSGTTGPATIFYNHTASFTIPSDGAALIHHLWAAPPALNTIDNATSAGINICAGSGLGDFYAWKASGSDFEPSPRGGWTNYAINPAIGSADHTVGTAPSTYSMIGVAVSATAQARGNPNACNAVRHGRCEAIFTNGDSTNGYATFSGFGAVDNATTARWNLLEPIGTSGFLMQGLMSLGQAATSVDFRDANKSINIKNTINVTAAFNAIEINHASSNVEWTAISITTLGTNSKGTFEVIDNATVAKDACTFTDMNTFLYQSNSTIDNSIFRRCGLVTVGGATFDGCTFDNASGSISVSTTSLELLTGCTFNSDGSNHAVELTSLGSGAMDWDNQLSGYATSDGSTGNEGIYVNVGTGNLTINVQSGASTPYIRTAGAVVTVVAGSVPVSVTSKTQAGVAIEDAYVYLRASDGTGPFPYKESVTITNSGTTATVAHTGHGMATNDKVSIRGANQQEYNGVKQITVTGVDAYTFVTAGSPTSPATGTIISTFVALEGFASALGVVSTSRAYTANQPVKGWSRKSDASPFYKQTDINDIITSAAGFTTTVGLISDE